MRGHRFTLSTNTVLLLALALAVDVAAASQFPSFDEYCQQFGKSYVRDTSEYEMREQTYRENLKLINERNQYMVDRDIHMLGVGPFTDVSVDEFSRRLMKPRRVPLTLESEFESGSGSPSLSEVRAGRRSWRVDVDLPDTFDWRDKGAVTGVKDQGTVGSCWAFSTTGNLEGQNFLKHSRLLSLSEEQLVDCDYLDCGVFGGWPLLAYEYIHKAGGIQTEETFPYCCGTGKCYPCMANKNKTFCGPPPEFCDLNCTADPAKFEVKVESWRNISQNEDEMMQELVSTGPLSVLINADGLQFHHSGVWDPPKWLCDPTSLDHAVLLVGFGTHKSILGDKPYWLIKNSWGTKWGSMGGYFMMKRGDGVCGVNRAVSTAIVE